MNNLPYQLQQQIEAAKQSLNSQFNQFAGSLRQEHAKRAQMVDQRLSDLGAIAKAMSLSGAGGTQGIVRIEDIPGKRIPFDYFVDIPILNNTTSTQQGTITISQEGPFVAVKRFASFQSLLQYQVSNGTNVAPSKYLGRSYGRWRPISSVWDIFDAHNNTTVQEVVPFTATPATAYIGMPELTSTQSGFRSMEFDGRIMVIDSGSSLRRSNISIPSSVWADGFGGLAELGCLDFLERGQVLTIQVDPLHGNNPSNGNADGTNIFGSAGWPFLAGQFDQHEGIVTPSAFSVASSPYALTRLGTDSITRLPDGVLTIGFVGYIIQQPPGVG